MSALALLTANTINVIESNEQHTAAAGVAITAGEVVMINATTGKWAKANSDTAANARGYGIALSTVAAGMPLTALRKGIVDGFDLSSIAYDADVYIGGAGNTAGTIDTAAGTIPKIIGSVLPVFSQSFGAASDKALKIDFSNFNVNYAVVGHTHA